MERVDEAKRHCNAELYQLRTENSDDSAMHMQIDKVHGSAKQIGRGRLNGGSSISGFAFREIQIYCVAATPSGPVYSELFSISNQKVYLYDTRR